MRIVRAPVAYFRRLGRNAVRVVALAVALLGLTLLLDALLIDDGDSPQS